MIIKKTKFGYVRNLLFISIPLFIMLKILSEFNSVNSLSEFIFLLFFVSAIAVINVYAGARFITY